MGTEEGVRLQHSLAAIRFGQVPITNRATSQDSRSPPCPDEVDAWLTIPSNDQPHANTGGGAEVHKISSRYWLPSLWHPIPLLLFPGATTNHATSGLCLKTGKKEHLPREMERDNPSSHVIRRSSKVFPWQPETASCTELMKDGRCRPTRSTG